MRGSGSAGIQAAQTVAGKGVGVAGGVIKRYASSSSPTGSRRGGGMGRGGGRGRGSGSGGGRGGRGINKQNKRR